MQLQANAIHLEAGSFCAYKLAFWAERPTLSGSLNELYFQKAHSISKRELDPQPVRKPDRISFPQDREETLICVMIVVLFIA